MAKLGPKNPVTGKKISLSASNLINLTLGGVVLLAVAAVAKMWVGLVNPALSALNPTRYSSYVPKMATPAVKDPSPGIHELK